MRVSAQNRERVLRSGTFNEEPEKHNIKKLNELDGINVQRKKSDKKSDKKTESTTSTPSS